MLGDPVAHSLSPAMHNSAIAALGLDAVCVALRVRSEGVESLVRELAAAGAGLNVTVPHKRRVAAMLDDASEAVARTGACNTVWARDGGLAGDNTDVAGVADAAARLVGERPVRRALIVGTGGAARAAAVAVAERWPGAVIESLSRGEDRARQFVEWARGAGLEACRDEGGPAELMINATPLGLDPRDPLPLDRERLRRRAPTAVLDLVYARGRTAFVRAAGELGIRAEDGRGVLLCQGAASFRRFFGVQPPRDVMRAAVEAALGE